MKKTLILFSILLLSSCDSDDDNKPVQNCDCEIVTTEDKKTINKITGEITTDDTVIINTEKTDKCVYENTENAETYNYNTYSVIIRYKTFLKCK